MDDDKKSEASSTSSDSAFVAKLISPNAERDSKMITTPIKKRRNTNPESRPVKDLNAQILLQQKVISDLRHKLTLVRDISNDAKEF